MTVLIRGDEMKIEAALQVGTVGEFVTVTTDVKTIEKASQRADGTPIPSALPAAERPRRSADVINATP
jgi:hypothetical protein